MSLTRNHVIDYKELGPISICTQILMFEDIAKKKRRNHTVPASLTLTSLGQSIHDNAEQMNKISDEIHDRYIERDAEGQLKKTKHKDPADQKFVFKKEVEGVEGDIEEAFEAELKELQDTKIELSFRPCPAESFGKLEYDPWVIGALDFIFD